jgi:hypothetical protein
MSFYIPSSSIDPDDASSRSTILTGWKRASAEETKVPRAEEE